MLVLGISAYHGDSAAAILRDGKVLAAVEEERFTRVKHWAGFPEKAIAYCLEQAGAPLDSVDFIALNRDPRSQFIRKAKYVLAKRLSAGFVLDRLSNRRRLTKIDHAIAQAFDFPVENLRPKIRNVEHHLAHAASSFFMSPFTEAAVLSVDSFGDWTSTLSAVASGQSIQEIQRVFFPHSLGVLYTAVTQFLGFRNYGDEYKVMGMAPYGQARYLREFEDLVQHEGEGRFSLNLKYFTHPFGRLELRFFNGAPVEGQMFSDELVALLGPARSESAELTQRHKDIAASLQAMYEKIFFLLLGDLHRVSGSRSLCLSGGCSMNSVANGKVFRQSSFERLHLPPASGDAGGSIGAAAYVYTSASSRQCESDPRHAYLGPSYSDDEIEQVLSQTLPPGERAFSLHLAQDEPALCREIAQDIADGKVVGWFQGRLEWGPRALGNRSILGDPRRSDMKEILNLKIKKREGFRPFAPSILREAVDEYFEEDIDVPFMSMVLQIREEKRHLLPAVTHVNGSGRLQTVRERENPLYYMLIKAFGELTGVPIVLNTSFNENEPIVCSPREALDCFLRTEMDTLAMSKFVLKRTEA